MAKRRAKGTGTVFYRHPTETRKGTWVARYEGRTKQAPTRDAARAALKAMIAEGEPAPVGELLLADYLTRWVEVQLPRLPLKPKTMINYRDMIKWYAVPAARGPLAGFGVAEAEEWLDRVRASRKRNGGRISPSTVRGTFQATSRALDTARRDGLVAMNPLRLVERPRNPKAAVPVSDTQAVLQAVEGLRIAPLVAVVAYTGMRISEALALEWGDVDLERGTAILRKTKSDRTRSVTLVTEASEALVLVRQRQTDEKWELGAAWGGSKHIFSSAQGNPPDYRSLTRQLSAALKEAGLETARPWHSLRHAAAHRMLEAGVPMHQVSAMLGHSSVMVTVDVYGHVSSSLDRAALERAFEKR